MSEAETAPEQDRLPWLGEEGEAPREHRTRDAIGLAVVAALLIFGVSYWIASQNWQRAREQREAATAPPVAAPLPKAPAREQAAVKPRHQRQQIASSGIRRVAAEPQKQQVAASKAVTTPVAPKSVAKAAKAVTAVARNAVPKAANPAAPAPAAQVATAREPRGSSGRVVRIGAFASPVQAQLGWRNMVRAYPALAHLPAVVVDASSSRTQPLYRFQIGTTSQASTDLLCQRMARINFSCGAMGPREVGR